MALTTPVTVSDAARNPDDPQSDNATTLAFTIDNTAPIITGVRAEKTATGWILRASGSDVTSPLAGAEWRVAPTPTTPVAPPATASTTATTSTTTAATKADDGDKAITISASDSNSNTSSFWQAFAAEDGLFDSKSETIVATLDAAFTTAPLKSGQKVEVRLRDAAGNFTTSTIELP